MLPYVSRGMTNETKPQLGTTTRIFGAWTLLGAAPVLAARLDPRIIPTDARAFGELALAHPVMFGAAWMSGFVGSLMGARAIMNVWFNQIRPWVAGTNTQPTDHAFAPETIELVDEVNVLRSQKNGAGRYFVGLKPGARRRLLGQRRGTAQHITDTQRTMHVHVLGQTGSGKSASVLFPLALQDALAGKAVIVMDGKGSEENINAITNIAAVAGRLDKLRIFSLPFPERSHTYNPFWLKPRTPAAPTGGDPLAVSERVFSVFKTEMEEPFYRSSSEAFLRSVVRVLHGIVGNDGHSVPFNAKDVLTCVQNRDVLDDCCERTLDQEAFEDIQGQLSSLGKIGNQAFAGLQNLLQGYTLSPVLNAYAPDITMEQVLDERLIVYFQLPANFYGQLTQSIGKIVLQELQQAAARRQLNRALDQTPVGIFIDEFYSFAYEGFIDALNKLRDSKMQFLLAHQSLSDLERVSKEFAAGIWDNTRTKVILYQNNFQLCEQIAKGIGTYQTVKVTTRKSVGDLALSVDLGEQSRREVEEFRLHPNAIKNLAPCGQAYLIESSHHTPLNLGQLPPQFFERWEGTKPPAPRAQTAGLNLRELGRAKTKKRAT